MKATQILFLMLITVLPVRAHAWIEICNRSGKEFLVSAAVSSAFGLITNNFNIRGWYYLKQGCQPLHITGTAASAQVIIHRLEGKNLVPAENSYRIREVRSNNKTVSGPSVMEASHRRICLPTKDFSLKRKGPVSSWTRCRSGEQLLPSTVFVFGRASQTTTINIDKKSIYMTVR